MRDPITYNVVEELATLDSGANYTTRFTMTAFNDNPARFDIRRWKIKEGGALHPRKGIQLSRESLVALRDCLNNMNL